MAKVSPRVGTIGNASLHTVSKPTHTKVQTLVSGLFPGFLFLKILPGIYIYLYVCIFILSTVQEKMVQRPNSLIHESYSTTNKSSAYSQEKGSKIKSVADNKDGEASSMETVLANYSTTMYELTISSN